MGENEVEVAQVVDYFSHVGVVALKVTAESIDVGDVLHFKGHTTDFTEEVKSIQIEHESVEKVKVGDVAGIKVSDRVRAHDHVFKVIS